MASANLQTANNTASQVPTQVNSASHAVPAPRTSLAARLAAAPPVTTIVVNSPAQDQLWTVEDERSWAFKRVGYPGLARWMGQSEDFLLVRRFDALNARVLLTLQDEISQHEERLNFIDQYYMNFPVMDKSKRSPTDILQSQNGTIRKDQDPERRQILETLKWKLKEYSELDYGG
jgi:hypothetical protein